MVQHRLQGEYGVKTSLEILPHELIRWVEGPPEVIKAVYWQNAKLIEDSEGQQAALFPNLWTLNWMKEQNPKLKFRERNEKG